MLKTELPTLSDDIKDFLELFDGEDILSWTNDELVDFAQNYVKDADDTLKSFLKTWDGTGDIAESYQQYLAQASSSTAKFVASLKSMVASAAISVAVSVVVSAFREFIAAEEEVSKKAEKLGNSFKSTEEDIADYKEEVEQLHETINSSSSSIEEVADARKRLMEVQNELIGKYGTEQNSIDAITQAVKGQTKAVDEQADVWERLTAAQWQETAQISN